MQTVVAPLFYRHLQTKPLPPRLPPRQAMVAASHHRSDGDNRRTFPVCLCPPICRQGGGRGADDDYNLTPSSTLTQLSSAAVAVAGKDDRVEVDDRVSGRRGRIVVVVSTSPSSPATDRRAETCSEGPLIVSVAAMVAGGDHSLLWRWAGRQWLRLPVAIKKGGNYGP